MADETYIYAGAEAHGLYRKKASDTHWEQLTNGMPPMPQARPIAIHPHHPEVLFVGTQRGVYRSQDRGDHWQRMHLPEGRTVWSLQFHPHDPQIMFLGTEGAKSIPAMMVARPGITCRPSSIRTLYRWPLPHVSWAWQLSRPTRTACTPRWKSGAQRA